MPSFNFNKHLFYRYRKDRKRRHLLFVITLAAILAGGIFIRIAQYANIPPGLNIDEASSAYEAYSLLHTGADRWGNHYPSYFPGWGAGQNVLLSYLSMPVVAMLGLNVFSARLVMLIFGILTLPLFFYALRPMGRFAAVLGIAMLSFVPWHFMLSRWSLESNLVPFFMLLGCFCLARALITMRRSWIIVCLVPFALALYAYGTTVVILPILFLLVLLLFFNNISLNAGAWLLSLLLFAIVSFPFLLSLYKNYVIHREIAWTDHLFFSAPLYPANRLSQVSGTNKCDVIWNNILFIINGCNDGTPYNLMSQYPLLHLHATILSFAGFIFVLAQLISRRPIKSSPTTIVTLIFWSWFVASLALAFLFELNTNRFNHFYIPCLVMGIWFVAQMIRKLVVKRWQFSLQIFIICAFTTSKAHPIFYYFSNYEEDGIKAWFSNGLGEAIHNADGMNVPQVYIANHMPLPDVYTLFYTSYPPERFQREAQIDTRNNSYLVTRFGKFLFSEDLIDHSKPCGYVARKESFSNRAGKRVLFQNDIWEVGTLQ